MDKQICLSVLFSKCRTQMFTNLNLILQSVILRLTVVIKRDREVRL